VELAVFQVRDGSRPLNASQVEDINKFLRTSSTAALLRLMAIQLLTVQGAVADPSSLNVLKPAFQATANRWNAESSSEWREAVTDVWLFTCESLRQLLPKSESLLESDEDAVTFTEFIRAPLSGSPSLASRFMRRIVDISGNLELLSRTRDLITDIAQSNNASRLTLFTHLDTDLSVDDHTKLYIPRDLTVNSGSRRSANSMLRGPRPYRLVLLGNPGAGKSTLVENLCREPGPEGNGVVIFRCRDYLASGFSASIPDQLTKIVQRNYSLSDVSVDLLECCLLLGTITVIFDGLDEIINVQRRAEFVDCVERFVHQFPLSPILVTSRQNGYQQAPLSETLFEIGQLEDFTSEQMRTYAQRWFGLVGKSELVNSFLQESKSVKDIANNPLMLSLLCSVYRAHGAIPSNRFGVYEKCADLLFRRWDAHRQISQHEDLPDYGSRVIEQVALQFYMRGSTQAGIDERRIIRGISGYLAETYGVVDPEPRAKSFVDFCAGRAWLLAKLGTSDDTNTPIFGFTHRTFYEFFAAKAIVRTEERIEDVARHIIDAYAADASSVLPELLIQAKEESTEKGAARVFQSVCDARPPSDLLLRLMNTPLSRSSRRAGLDIVCSRWSERRTYIRLEEFESLIDLHRDPREQFIEDYVLSDSDVWLRSSFIQAWTAYALRLDRKRFSDSWVESVDPLIDAEKSRLEIELQSKSQRAHRPQFEPTQFEPAVHWLVSIGKLPASLLPVSSLLLVDTFGKSAPGAAFYAFLQSDRDDDVRTALANRLNTAWAEGVVAPRGAIKEIGSEIGDLALNLRPRQWSSAITDAAVGMAMLFEEANAPLAFMNRAITSLGIDIEALVKYRAYKKGRTRRPDDELGRSASRASGVVASWAKSWAVGNHNLTMRSVERPQKDLRASWPQPRAKLQGRASKVKRSEGLRKDADPRRGPRLDHGY
jgi:hypothetical protein